MRKMESIANDNVDFAKQQQVFWRNIHRTKRENKPFQNKQITITVFNFVWNMWTLLIWTPILCMRYDRCCFNVCIKYVPSVDDDADSVGNDEHQRIMKKQKVWRMNKAHQSMMMMMKQKKNQKK